MRGRNVVVLAIVGLAFATLGGLPVDPLSLSAHGAPAGPSVRITRSPAPKTFERRPRFDFESPDNATARLQCSLDGRRWRRCSSPFRAWRLARGRHTFKVRALGPTGDGGQPAKRRFRVLSRQVKFGHSVRGAKLRAVRLGNPNAARKALVVGSIHGNEREGHEVVRLLRRRYRDLRGVELWVVKTVNPDGVEAGRRSNARGVDLNRNFSYRWNGGASPSTGEYPGPHPFSEPESRAVRRLVKRVRPRVTIWYHQPWGQVLLPCHGRAQAQRRYARVAHLPPQRCRGQRLPGTATKWQNHRGPGTAFVVELPSGELSKRDARRHARAVVRVATSHGNPHAHDTTEPAAAPPLRVKLGRPRFDRDPIPYGKKRKHQMAAYSKRHYGKRRWQLRNRRVIVLHFTGGSTYRSAWETFASNAPNTGERPGVCSHFVIAKNGRIHRLVRPAIRCRHAIGLNHRAIGVEMVQETGPSSHWADRQILHRDRQLKAALRLVGWLKQRFGIKMREVIGHAMANDSSYFKDLEGWRNDHTDWLRRDVVRFRHRLRKLLGT